MAMLLHLLVYIPLPLSHPFCMLTLNQFPEKDLSEPGWCSYNWKVDTFRHAAHDKTGGHGRYVLAVSHEKKWQFCHIYGQTILLCHTF